jgi:hypothetical protein
MHLEILVGRIEGKRPLGRPRRWWVGNIKMDLREILIFYFAFVCEAIGTADTPGLLWQPRVIVKMIVEKKMQCRLAGETEVLGDNLPQRHFCPSQNPT